MVGRAARNNFAVLRDGSGGRSRPGGSELVPGVTLASVRPDAVISTRRVPVAVYFDRSLPSRGTSCPSRSGRDESGYLPPFHRSGPCPGTLAAARPADAGHRPGHPGFVNADIAAVVQAMGKITSLFLDPRVRRERSTSSRLNRSTGPFFRILLSSLRLRVIPPSRTTRVVKIVPGPTPNSMPYRPSAARRQTGDRLVAGVPTSQRSPAAQIVGVLRPMISPDNTIAAYPPATPWSYTGYAENIRRLGPGSSSPSASPRRRPGPAHHHYLSHRSPGHHRTPSGRHGCDHPRQRYRGGTYRSRETAASVSRSSPMREPIPLVRSDSPSKIAAGVNLANLDVPGPAGNATWSI